MFSSFHINKIQNNEIISAILFMLKCLDVDGRYCIYVSDFKMTVIGRNVTLFDTWKYIRGSHQRRSGLQVFNFIKKRLQNRYFPVNIAKFLRTPFRRTSANGYTYYIGPKLTPVPSTQFLIGVIFQIFTVKLS